jgi:hypothetical protein
MRQAAAERIFDAEGDFHLHLHTLNGAVFQVTTGRPAPWSSSRLYGYAARATSVRRSQVESSGLGYTSLRLSPGGRAGPTSNSRGTGRCV